MASCISCMINCYNSCVGYVNGGCGSTCTKDCSSGAKFYASSELANAEK